MNKQYIVYVRWVFRTSNTGRIMVGDLLNEVTVDCSFTVVLKLHFQKFTVKFNLHCKTFYVRNFCGCVKVQKKFSKCYSLLLK